jgi:hypothetical protein
LFYVLGVPLVVAGAIFAFPAVSSLVDDLFPENNFPTVVPVVDTLVPVNPTSPEPLQTFAPPPTPISISRTLCPAGPDVQIFAPEVEANNMVWRIHNADDEDVSLDFGVLEFPAANDALLEIRFGDEVVWHGSATSADQVHLVDEARQSIKQGTITQIAMEFTWPPANDGYTLILSFGSGCRFEATW